jgi:hypothetical protein
MMLFRKKNRGSGFPTVDFRKMSGPLEIQQRFLEEKVQDRDFQRVLAGIKVNHFDQSGGRERPSRRELCVNPPSQSACAEPGRSTRSKRPKKIKTMMSKPPRLPISLKTAGTITRGKVY